MTYYDLKKRTPEQEADDTAAYEKKRAWEQAEAEAHRIATVKLIREICAELNKPYNGQEFEWSIMSYDPAEYIDRWPDLIHKDGRKIDFSNGKGIQRLARQRLNIGGHWPQAPGNGPVMSPYQVGEKSPSIEVSRDRGAAVIAREITRRFLPEYTRIWHKCQAKIDATNAHIADTEHNFQKLCEVLGINAVKQHHGSQDQAKISVYEYFRGAGYGELTVSGGSVDFHLRSLPMPIALEIAMALGYIHNRPLPGAPKWRITYYWACECGASPLPAGNGRRWFDTESAALDAGKPTRCTNRYCHSQTTSPYYTAEHERPFTVHVLETGP